MLKKLTDIKFNLFINRYCKSATILEFPFAVHTQYFSCRIYFLARQIEQENCKYIGV